MKSKESSILEQIDSLHHRFVAFRGSTKSLTNRNNLDSKDLEELEAAVKQVDLASLSLVPSLEYLGLTLVESVQREIGVRQHLIQMKNIAAAADRTDTEVYSSDQFVELQHSSDLCKHVKVIECNMSSHVSSDFKLDNLFTSKIQNDDSSFDKSSEMEALLNYTNKLNSYVKDMVNFYHGRLQKFDENVKGRVIFPLSPKLAADIFVELETHLPKSGRLMNDVKECHRLIFCLNDILNLFDEKLEYITVAKRRVDQELGELKRSNQEKEFSVDSYIKQLNEKMINLLKENKRFETELVDLRSATVCKSQYQLVEEERNKLIDIKAKLEEQLESLKEEKSQIAQESSVANEKGGGEIVVELPDLSIICPLKSPVTSTPFPKRPNPKTGPEFNSDIYKTTLMEWVKRCHNLDSEKKMLQRKVFKQNFTFKQVNFTKDILERQIDILQTNIKNLEMKCADYISLKEKCYILENDLFALNLKFKGLTEFENRRMKKNQEYTCPIDSQVPTQFEPSPLSSTSAVISFVKEHQRKNQRIILLESKCRAKGALVEELTFKLNQSKEIEKALQNKIDGLISDSSVMFEKLNSLIEENSQINLEKRLLEIESKSVKDQLNHLISSNVIFHEDPSDGLIEVMKNNALSLLKDSIDRWSKVEQRVAETTPCQSVERLDARHHIEILMKNNSLLKNENNELLLKLTQLHHQFQSLQVK